MRDEAVKSSDAPERALERRPSEIIVDSGSHAATGSAKILRLIWTERSQLLRWAVYGLVASAIIAFLIPRRFESTARLMPPDQQNSPMAMLAAAAGGRGGSGLGSGGAMGGLGSIAGDLLGMKNSGELFIGMLQSRTVQDDIVNKFDLRKVYRDRYMEDARKELEKNTEVTEDRKSGIITMRVTDKDPQRAAALAQEYLTELNRVVILLNTSAARREREFLEGRLVQVKLDLESAENGFSDFASKNTALDIPAQGKAMIEASAALEGQLIGAQTELESLRQIYADGNVRVRTTQARVDELRHQLEKIGGKFDNETPGTGRAEDQSMYPSIRKLPLLGVKYADLYRNTRVQEAVFETLTQEYELAKVQEAKETPSVKILDAPNIPEKKSYPPRLAVIALGTMVVASLYVAYMLGSSLWVGIDAHNPHKMLAQEISETTRQHLFWRHDDQLGNENSNGHSAAHSPEPAPETDEEN